MKSIKISTKDIHKDVHNSLRHNFPKTKKLNKTPALKRIPMVYSAFIDFSHTARSAAPTPITATFIMSFLL